MFQIVQLVYWVGLSTWFGGAMFVALAAPVIFKTVRESNPILTDVLSVNLEGQHGTLLAGSIVVDLIRRLMRVEIVCGAAVLVGLVGQVFLIDDTSVGRTALVSRAVLFVAAAATILFDRISVWPRLRAGRLRYIEHADEPDVANPAKDQFDRDQRLSVLLLSAVVAFLLGMIVFSATIKARPVYETRATGAG